MAESSKFYKRKPEDAIWWVDNTETTGVFEFSFDRETVYNLFADYPEKLTQEQKIVFDKENPEWASFFNDKEQRG